MLLLPWSQFLGNAVSSCASGLPHCCSTLLCLADFTFLGTSSFLRCCCWGFCRFWREGDYWRALTLPFHAPSALASCGFLSPCRPGLCDRPVHLQASLSAGLRALVLPDHFPQIRQRRARKSIHQATSSTSRIHKYASMHDQSSVALSNPAVVFNPSTAFATNALASAARSRGGWPMPHHVTPINSSILIQSKMWISFSSFGVNAPTSTFNSGISSCCITNQRCIIPLRCVVFMAGVDVSFVTHILPVMAAHLYPTSAVNHTRTVSFARGSKAKKNLLSCGQL